MIEAKYEKYIKMHNTFRAGLKQQYQLHGRGVIHTRPFGPLTAASVNALHATWPDDRNGTLVRLV